MEFDLSELGDMIMASVVAWEFNEEICLNECLSKFEEIRNKYKLDDNVLKWAQDNSLCANEVVPVIKGGTKQGIKELASESSSWGSKKLSFGLLLGSVIASPMDPNLIAVESLSNYYKGKCKVLSRKIKQSGYWENLASDK